VFSYPDDVSSATRRSILLLSTATFSSMVTQRICDAMLPELSRIFAVSLSKAAQVVSVFAITYGICQLIFGPLGDRLGKYRIVTLCAFFCSVGSVVAALADSLDVLLFARLLTAVGAAGMIPLAMAWVGDAVPTHRLQEMLTRTGLGSTLGLVIGQLLGGLLTDAFGWRWCFAFLTVLFAIVGTLLYTDLRRQGITLLPQRKDDSAEGAQAVANAGFIKQAWQIASGPWSRIVLCMAIVEGAVGFGVLAIWASHLHNKLGLSLSVAGAIVSLFGLGGMLYMALGRRLIARFGQQGLVMVGGAVLGVSACLIAFTPHWLAAVPASMFAGFGFFMFHNTMQTTATGMSTENRGTGVSLFSSALFLGQSIGVVMAAGLIDLIGSSAVIAGGGAVMALEGLFFAWALRRRESHSSFKQNADSGGG
jgi:YNFM family putative membrane transporter